MKNFKTFDGEVFETLAEALDWLEQYSLTNPEQHITEIEVEEETLTS